MVWRVEETWVVPPNGKTADRGEFSERELMIHVKINADNYSDGHERSTGLAYRIACETFGEGNFSGPWHDN